MVEFPHFFPSCSCIVRRYGYIMDEAAKMASRLIEINPNLGCSLRLSDRAQADSGVIFFIHPQTKEHFHDDSPQ